LEVLEGFTWIAGDVFKARGVDVVDVLHVVLLFLFSRREETESGKSIL
jgi:hypothetical protein